MIRESLPLRVLAISFIVLALPLLVDSFVFFQSAYYESIKDAENDLRESANFRAFSLSETAPVRQLVLKELNYFLSLGEKLPDLTKNREISEKLEEISKMSEGIEIQIVDTGEEGLYTNLASSNPSHIGTTFKGYSQLIGVLEGKKTNFLRYVYDPQDNKFYPYYYVAEVIRSPTTNKIVGVALIARNIESVIKGLIEPRKNDNGDTIHFALLNEDSFVFAATDPNLIGNYFSTILPAIREELLETDILGDVPVSEQPLTVILEKNSPYFEFIFADQVQLAFQATVPLIDVYFLAYSQKEQVFSNSISHFLMIYSVYGLILIIGGAVTYWLTIWFSKPLKQLMRLMNKVNQGLLNVRFQEEPLGFEINLLGGIFNQTLDALLENIQKAEDERVLKETYRKEIDIGKEVQQNLLPQTMPEVEGIDFGAEYRVDEKVGGDFYDVFMRDEKDIILTIADAAGQGISACLYSLTVRSLLRTYTSLEPDVDQILAKSNTMFLKDTGDSGMFVSVLMGIFDTHSHTLSYFSCGHVPGIIRRAAGDIEILKHEGIALGVSPSMEFQKHTTQLFSGDILLFYTDGVTHVINTKGEPYTFERLVKFIQSHPWEKADDLVKAIMDEILLFTEGAPQEKERTLLAMHIK